MNQAERERKREDDESKETFLCIDTRCSSPFHFKNIITMVATETSLVLHEHEDDGLEKIAERKLCWMVRPCHDLRI